MAFKNLRAELAELFAEETFDPSPELLSDGRLLREQRQAALRRRAWTRRMRAAARERRRATTHGSPLPPLEPVASCASCRKPLYTAESLRRHHCRRITPPV